MSNYKPNSHRSKELAEVADKKKVEKVTTGKVVKKKNGMRKLTTALVAEEDSNTLKKYILWDVLIPAGKKMIQETVNTILYGIGAKGTGGGNTIASKVSYNGYYGRNSSTYSSSNNRSGRARVGYSYDDIELDSRADAEHILQRMGEILDTYEVVTVSDLYELAGLSSDFPDTKYGWISLSRAEIINTGNGFVIKMPRATPIDN